MGSYLIALLAAVGACIGAFTYGVGVGEDRQIAADSKAAAQVLQATELAAQGAAAEIAKLKPIHRTTYQTIEKEVREKLVFTDCRSGPVSVRAFNAAIPGARPDTAASGVVPAPDPDH